MVDHMEYRSDQRQRTVHAEQQGDEAKVADGRIGQDAFHVLLEDRQVTGDYQRAQAGSPDDPEPVIGARQHWP